jgi:hypothetical protein
MFFKKLHLTCVPISVSCCFLLISWVRIFLQFTKKQPNWIVFGILHMIYFPKTVPLCKYFNIILIASQVSLSYWISNIQVMIRKKSILFKSLKLYMCKPDPKKERKLRIYIYDSRTWLVLLPPSQVWIKPNNFFSWKFLRAFFPFMVWDIN